MATNLAALPRPCSSSHHEALKRSPAAWQALELVGVQRVPEGDEGPAYELELRNCSCGSSLAVRVASAHCYECGVPFAMPDVHPFHPDAGPVECASCGETATTTCRDCCRHWAADDLDASGRCEPCAESRAVALRAQRRRDDYEAACDAKGDAMRQEGF